MRCAHVCLLALTLTLGLGSSTTGQAPQTSPAPQTAPAAKPVPPAAPARTRQSPPAGSRLSLTVMVTALDGKTLPEVVVKAAGPVDREAPTDPSGLVTFANMAPGTYRLRFEHQDFITLEKEIGLAAGKPLRASASLSAAPPAAPPPKVEPAAPPPVVSAPAGNYQPHVANFESWIDSSFVGRAPSKRLAAGCTASATSAMVQTNESIAERTRGDSDETIYVVAGEGTLRMGGRDHPLNASSLVTIPRGAAHSITRRGSRPLMFVSTVSGPPCQGGQ